MKILPSFLVRADYRVCAETGSNCGFSPEIRGLSPIPMPTLALYEQEHSRSGEW